MLFNTAVLFVLSYLMPMNAGYGVEDLTRSPVDWASKFQETRDEGKELAVMDSAMNTKINAAIKKAEMSMIKSKKKTTYVTISQDVHLGRADEKVNIQKLAMMERISRWAASYPWVNLRKMTVMWKTGVSSNVRWGVKMSFVDRRDYNDETRELFMMEFPVSDNFIMMMAPGYTAYMALTKGMLPWRFDFDFPDGEFTSQTVFGTLKIKLEIDQYKEATQVEEITPMVKFTRVQPAVQEPVLRWMSKGKWFQSSATRPDPEMLDTIHSAAEDLNAKQSKFLAFLGFDPVKVRSTPIGSQIYRVIDPADLRSFEHSPLSVAKSFNEYQAKYRELIQRALSSSVYN
nr:TPA_asm: P2 [Medicago trirhavirus 1]